MRTEDRFYFGKLGKPGQPERFAEDFVTPIGPSMLDKIKSAIASGQTVYVSTMTRITKVTPKTYKQWEAAGRPLFKLDSKGNLLMGSGSSYNRLTSGPLLSVGITMRHESSRPGQPERFGLEDACWDGYEPVGTKQKDGRTVPNCVPKAKNEQPEEFAASGLTSAISEFLSAVPAGATRDALQKALIDYADNSAAEARMRDQGNPSDASRFGVAAGRAAQIAARSWDRLGKPVARLRDFMQGLTRMRFSRPGQPERFAASGWKTIEAYLQVLDEEFGTPRGKEAAQTMMRAAESLGGSVSAALRTAIRTAATSKNVTDRGRAIGQIEDMLESASFSRPGQPERFAAISKGSTVRYSKPQSQAEREERFRVLEINDGGARGKRVLIQSLNPMWKGRLAPTEMISLDEVMLASRPGQPERFSDAMRGLSGPWTPNPRGKHRYKPGDRVKLKHWNNPLEGRVDRLVRDMYGLPAYVVYWDKGGTAQVHDAEVFSCPGQPERFDASSLNRADFSDASKSPILGKLLAAKAMPDGGWRAVQAGSDTLVISFEDGDVAGDFGKRAASKGFNATSPVQAIGRYWNVEVKNGK